MFWRFDMWQVTCDMWHVTCDMWHVTYDMCHVTNMGWWTLSQNFRPLALLVWEWQCFEDLTCDMWHVTCDIWHVTLDKWHVTRDSLGVVNIASKFQVPSSNGLRVIIFWKFDIWHVTCDMWHVICDTWHVKCVTWQIWGGEHRPKISGP